MNNEKTAINFILIAGCIVEVFFIVFVLLSFTTGNIPLFIFVYVETFLIMLCVFYLLKKLDFKSRLQTGKKYSDSFIVRLFAKILSIEKPDAYKLKIPLLIILFGIVFRITLLPAVNTTSPDVNRYIWEGKILYHGFNPYTTSPDDEHLSQFHDNLYRKVTFKDMTAIYPPMAQLTFVAAYVISGENLIGLKLIYLLFDLLIIFFLLKLFYIKKIDLNNIILYAWIPLVLLEFFVNTHLDLIGILFMILFIYFMEKEKFYIASVFFTFSFLSKMFPIILLPLIIKKAGIKKSFRFVLIFAGLIILFYFPFIYKDFSIFSSLTTYLKTWQFNASAFYLLKHQLSNESLARMICGFSFVALVGIISYLYKDFTRGVYGILIGWLIFSTTVYPWYLGWIAAINPLYSFYSVTSLLFTANFSNFTPMGTEWREYTSVLLIQYIPFYLLLINDLRLLWKKSKQENLVIEAKF
ncbi:MAG TPA: hypothetical protein VKA26_06945 [Ignavibacteriaceae bacterium]|nr:hypothetical protein [Ignavibacteriaceae bacterium]